MLEYLIYEHDMKAMRNMRGAVFKAVVNDPTLLGLTPYQLLDMQTGQIGS